MYDHKIRKNIIFYPFLPPIESIFDLNIGFSLCAEIEIEINLFVGKINQVIPFASDVVNRCARRHFSMQV